MAMQVQDEGGEGMELAAGHVTWLFTPWDPSYLFC